MKKVLFLTTIIFLLSLILIGCNEKEIQALNNQISNLNTELDSKSVDIEKLNKQVISLTEENETLKNSSINIFAEAGKLQSQEKYEEAITKYDELLIMYPKSIEAE